MTQRAAGPRPPEQEGERVQTRVLVVNQYYEPDVASSGRLLTELCRGLVKGGIGVSVVTGQPSYGGLVPAASASETLDGVRVQRVALGRARSRERMFTRISGYARFMWSAWRTARRLAKAEQPDVVLTFSNPPSVGLIAAYLAKRRGLRFIYVLHDIHPDILRATAWVRIPGAILWLWDVVHRCVLRRLTQSSCSVKA